MPCVALQRWAPPLSRAGADLRACPRAAARPCHSGGSIFLLTAVGDCSWSLATSSVRRLKQGRRSPLARELASHEHIATTGGEHAEQAVGLRP